MYLYIVILREINISGMNKDWHEKDIADVCFGDGHTFFVKLLHKQMKQKNYTVLGQMGYETKPISKKVKGKSSYNYVT